MKKSSVLLLAICLCAIVLPVYAEGAEAIGGAFFDWSYLATYSGAVAAVVFIVQFLKLPADRLGHVPTRALVYVVSLAVLLLAQLFTQRAFSGEIVALAMLNAVLVAFAAMGVYERAIAPDEAAKGGAKAHNDEDGAA